MAFFRIVDPVQSIINLENTKNSVKLLVQTTLRSVVGTFTISELLIGRQQITKQAQAILDTVTTDWGVKARMFRPLRATARFFRLSELN